MWSKSCLIFLTSILRLHLSLTIIFVFLWFSKSETPAMKCPFLFPSCSLVLFIIDPGETVHSNQKEFTSERRVIWQCYLESKPITFFKKVFNKAMLEVTIKHMVAHRRALWLTADLGQYWIWPGSFRNWFFWGGQWKNCLRLSKVKIVSVTHFLPGLK